MRNYKLKRAVLHHAQDGTASAVVRAPVAVRLALRAVVVVTARAVVGRAVDVPVGDARVPLTVALTERDGHLAAVVRGAMHRRGPVAVAASLSVAEVGIVAGIAHEIPPTVIAVVVTANETTLICAECYYDNT